MFFQKIYSSPHVKYILFKIYLLLLSINQGPLTEARQILWQRLQHDHHYGIVTFTPGNVLVPDIETAFVILAEYCVALLYAVLRKNLSSVITAATKPSRHFLTVLFSK